MMLGYAEMRGAVEVARLNGSVVPGDVSIDMPGRGRTGEDRRRVVRRRSIG
jgi:hypothetical protein